MFKVVNINYKSIIALGKYCRLYEIGKIVMAEKDSLGLMLFELVEEAIDFGKGTCTAFRILETEPIGRQFIPTRVCISGLDGWIDMFYKNIKDVNISSKAPYGTICVPALKVIREVENHQHKGVTV
jgi:hypothetical protein